MIVPIKKRFAGVRRLCMLCALFGLLAAVAHAADYRTGTYRGAAGVGIDPESGDRTVRILPPSAAEAQQQPPVYVYPQVDGTNRSSWESGQGASSWTNRSGLRPYRPGLSSWTDRPGLRPYRPGLPSWTDRPGQQPHRPGLPSWDRPGQRPDRPGLPSWTDRPGQRPDRPGRPSWADRPGRRPPYARPPYVSGGRSPFGR